MDMKLTNIILTVIILIMQTVTALEVVNKSSEEVHFTVEQDCNAAKLLVPTTTLAANSRMTLEGAITNNSALRPEGQICFIFQADGVEQVTQQITYKSSCHVVYTNQEGKGSINTNCP